MLGENRFQKNKNYPLIGPDDPPPIELLNPDGAVAVAAGL